MAFLDVLNSSYNGKLGNTYGVKQYGKHYAKAIPFSHTPYNQKQKNAFSAFGCLQRFASPIAKAFFDYLGLEAKKIYKINAVASFFKPMIKGGYFDIMKLYEVMPETELLEFGEIEHTHLNGKIAFSFNLLLENASEKNAALFFCAFNESGVPSTYAVTKSTSGYINLNAKGIHTHTLNIVTFLSYVENHKLHLRSIILDTLTDKFFVNQILYPQNFYNGVWTYDTERKCIIGTDVIYDFNDGILSLKTGLEDK